MDITENLPYVGMKTMAQNAGCWTQFPEEPTSGSKWIHQGFILILEYIKKHHLLNI